MEVQLRLQFITSAGASVAYRFYMGFSLLSLLQRQRCASKDDCHKIILCAAIGLHFIRATVCLLLRSAATGARPKCPTRTFFAAIHRSSGIV